MDEEIKAQLIPILENTREGLAAAVEMLKEQAPLLVKELLWWEGVKSAIFFCLGIVLLLILILTWKSIWRWAQEGAAKDSMWAAEHYVGGGVIIAILAIPGAILTLVNLTWLQILIAPRVFLLEYVAAWI